MSKENLNAPEEFDEDAAEIIELIDDDGNELKFKILDVIKYKGEKYALLLAAEPTRLLSISYAVFCLIKIY